MILKLDTTMHMISRHRPSKRIQAATTVVPQAGLLSACGPCATQSAQRKWTNFFASDDNSTEHTPQQISKNVFKARVCMLQTSAIGVC